MAGWLSSRDEHPILVVRRVHTTHQPRRGVGGSRLESSTQALILQPPGPVAIYTGAGRAAEAALLCERCPHLQVVEVPADAQGKTDLAAVLADLATRGVNELHVEAGHQLNGSLLKASLVDELLVYLAPKMLGPGRGMAAFGPLERLADGLSLAFIESTAVGPDLRIRARLPGRAEALEQRLEPLLAHPPPTMA